MHAGALCPISVAVRWVGWVGLPASGPFPEVEPTTVWTKGSGGGSRLARASPGGGGPGGQGGDPADHTADQPQQQTGHHPNPGSGSGRDQAVGNRAGRGRATASSTTSGSGTKLRSPARNSSTSSRLRQASS